MEKSKLQSYIEQCSFLMFLLIGITNKLWFKEEYLSTVSWAFLCVSLIAANIGQNRKKASPWWMFTVNLILSIGCIIILIIDIISYLR